MTAIDTKSQLPTLDPPATGGDAADPDVAMARRLAFGASTSLEHEPDVDRPEGRSWASRTIAIAGGLAAGIAALAVLAVTAVPADLVKARLISGIEAETGRKLSVNGRTSVVLFPGLAVKMTDVTLSSPESMNVQPLARVAAVDADVALWPLLAGRIEIRRLHLDRPVIELIVDSKGDRSWEVAAAAGPARVSVAAIEPARGGSGTTSDAGTSVLVPAAPSGRPSLAIADLSISEGTIRYMDARSGAAYEVVRIRADVAARDAASAIEVRGAARWRGEDATFRASASSLAELLSRRTARISLTVAMRHGEASFRGAIVESRASASPAPLIDGSLIVRSSALNDYSDWIGIEAPSLRGPVSIAGRLKAGPSGTSVSDAEIKVDGASGIGTISIEAGRDRPTIKVELRSAAVGLDALLATSGITTPPSRTARESGAGTTATVAAPYVPAQPTPKPAIVPPLTLPTKRTDPPPPQTMEELIRRSIGDIEPKPGRRPPDAPPSAPRR